MTKLVLLFLEFALDSTSKFNAIFSYLPMFPSLKLEVIHLLKLILSCFLKLEVVKRVERGNNFSMVDLDDTSLHLCNEEMGIGHKGMEFFLMKWKMTLMNEQKHYLLMACVISINI